MVGLKRQMRLMADQQDGAAVQVPAQQRQQCAGGRWIERREGFVEQQQCRVVEQQAGD
ncbi:hypothetical protein D3C77_630040 [compost metagenome]